jgi:hypothetical protein
MPCAEDAECLRCLLKSKTARNVDWVNKPVLQNRRITIHDDVTKSEFNSD